MKNKFYVTTPIYYVNDKPHIGHAYTTIIADVLARYYRNKLGEENVYFLTGTDEHGAKIFEAAKKENISPEEFTNNISIKFKKAWSNLDISNNFFIRTTDKNHKKIVTNILYKLKEADVLYESDYKGLYCISCERFLVDSDLVEGKCSYHNRKPEELLEKNWFFKLNKYLPKIKKLIESGELIIYPEGRKKEVLGLIDKQDLPNFSISRSKKSVPWGINLPWDEDQKVYVWIDALSNYITALNYPDGKNYNKFWPADIQLIALDILKFHALYWPAILLALNIPLPKSLYIHGFFTINGKKMSKTLGNVIDPNDLVEKYGAESTKYLILSQFSFGSESNIKIEKFLIKYNSDLVNGLGNLVNRVTNMIEKYLEGHINIDFIELPFIEEANKKIEKLNFRGALLDIWYIIKKDNSIIDMQKPWELFKNNDKEKLKNILQDLALDLYNIGLMLHSFMPKKSKEIINIITNKKVIKPKEPLFPRLIN